MGNYRNLDHLSINMATIYQKTVDDKCLILEPREALQRELNLPDDWKRVRIAIGLSITGSVSDPNTLPTLETITRLTELDRFYFGLKTSEVNAPHVAGKFVGISDYSSNPSSYPLSISSGYYIGNEANVIFSFQPTICDAGIRYQTASATGSNQIYVTSNPTNTTNYGAFVVLEIDVRTPGTLICRMGGSAEWIAQGAATTDFSDAALRDRLQNASFSPATTLTSGVYWGAGENPGTTHMYFRLPFFNNRARIHSYGYLLLA